MKWTEEQEQAIYEKNSNILVAAAAGSGKTAVLVERIINKVMNENIDIDSLLVVTFTNAAASEMRERILEAIYKKLDDNPEDEHLQKQITLLGKANICTIDAFCLDVIKNNFYEIEVSPNFRIADTAEMQLLKQEVLEELFENKYEENNQDFIKLINTYTSYRDDTPLKDLILKIYTYTQSNPFPEKWLEEKIEMFNLKDNLDKNFSETVWGNLLIEELEEELIDDITKLQTIKKRLSYYLELDKYEKVIENDIEQLQMLKANLKNWDKAYNISNELEFLKWPIDKKITLEEKEIAKEARDNIKKKLKKKLEKILISTSKEANQDIFDMYEILSKLKNIILEFSKYFSKKKKERNILDFNDIEHFALKILVQEDEENNICATEVAQMYKEKFNEIAIDEYQDSNLVQEYILTAISRGNNIFMVGDVKQSIYKFRQARPELFLDKYTRYRLKENKTEQDDLKIQLFKNFRSRENILEYTNIVFENIMSSLVGDIEYNQEEFLNLGASYKETEENLKVEINIVDLNKDNFQEEVEDEENEEAEKEILEQTQIEAKLVAQKIKQIIDSKFQIYDIKKEKFRDVMYKDIVILLRTTKDIAPIYEKEILELDMPVFCDTSAEYLDSIEVQTIMSILKIIDNPLSDIPLVTVLRSPVFGFTDNDLIKIRLADKYDNFYNTLLKSKLNSEEDLRRKIDNFLEKIEEWRKEKEYLALDELIWKIYTQTGYYNYVGLMTNGEVRQANLRMLFERAKQYETASFKGLFNFVKFIEKLQLSSGDLGAAKIIGETENVIRIMSIHKSKGLEFPVVFLSGTGKQFNLRDLNNNILLHQDIGVGVKFIDYEKQIEYDTLSKAAIRSKLLTETLSEEMRILYVALTRAKEKLIITGTIKDGEKKLKDIQNMVESYDKENNKINHILVKKYITYIDWILLTYIYNKERLQKISELTILDQKEVLNKKIEEKESKDVIELLENEEIDDKVYNNVKKLLEYEYKYKNSILIPTKTSVTKIKEMKNVFNTNIEETNNNKKEQFAKPKFLNNTEEEKITSARKGSLIHLCMQKLNEKKEYSKGDIKELVCNLQSKDIITEQEAKKIDCNKVYNFTKSFIWSELKEAKEVYKEKAFYMNIPAKEIYKNNVDEMILVQGIIDLYYINRNNELILVDYKTDYVRQEIELISKYKEQLNLYQEALEEALHKKVDKIYIYSTFLDKPIEVKK